MFLWMARLLLLWWVWLAAAVAAAFVGMLVLRVLWLCLVPSIGLLQPLCMLAAATDVCGCTNPVLSVLWLAVCIAGCMGAAAFVVISGVAHAKPVVAACVMLLWWSLGSCVFVVASSVDFVLHDSSCP